MPLYMDQHILPGVKARDVAEAHRRDLLIQADHRCNCMTYWIDEKRGTVFCLIEAPSADAVTEMHSKAHGLVPHKIIEVNSNLVESFLGRISDPEHAEMTNDGLRVFADESFRSIMVIQLHDAVLLQHRLGKEKAEGILRSQRYIIQKELDTYDGNEVPHGGAEHIASFVSGGKAVQCALSIRDLLRSMTGDDTQVHIGIHASEPITQSENLFGDTIQFARMLGFISRGTYVSISNSVRNMATKDPIRFDHDKITVLSAQDESFLALLFKTLEERWQEPGFDMEAYGKQMAMSTSQLYRKSVALTGQSPNNLLRDYRLERAKEMMNKSTSNITQITFETGFASPSYFTKCFKKKFGVLPMEYMA